MSWAGRIADPSPMTSYPRRLGLVTVGSTEARVTSLFAEAGVENRAAQVARFYTA